MVFDHGRILRLPERRPPARYCSRFIGRTLGFGSPLGGTRSWRSVTAADWRRIRHFLPTVPFERENAEGTGRETKVSSSRGGRPRNFTPTFFVRSVVACSSYRVLEKEESGNRSKRVCLGGKSIPSSGRRKTLDLFEGSWQVVARLFEGAVILSAARRCSKPSVAGSGARQRGGGLSLAPRRPPPHRRPLGLAPMRFGAMWVPM